MFAHRGRPLDFRILMLEAIAEEMRRDPDVFFIGCEISRYHLNLEKEFGIRRVIDTPISELANMGIAVGAARCRKRPVVDLRDCGFFFLAMDQLVNNASTTYDITNGELPMSLVVRGLTGISESPAPSIHCRMLHPMFMTIPGLRLVYPSCAEDAKGLMKAAIRDPGPVLYLEHQRLSWTAAVGKVEQHIKLGKAVVKRSGDDATVVAIGPMVQEALAAATILAEEGISIEVIDPRTLVPMDFETLLQSVQRTRRMLVVDEAHDGCSAASHIASVVAERAWGRLIAPIQRLTVANVNIPFIPTREWAAYVPTAPMIVKNVTNLCKY